MTNALFDTDFLSSLFEAVERIVYVRLIALDINERPIEYIEGKATGGSINLDGESIVRRSCQVTLVAADVNIHDFYWGLKTKFKLEIGLQNKINPNYPDIIWFKQGTYVITNFSLSQNTNSYTINISGKDKMCLLNGDLGGTLPHTTDFGIEEYYDKNTGITTYTSIPIRTIIRESVQNFGNELPENIIINDIEDAGLEQLEYRGDITLYLLKDIEKDVFTNMTINKKQQCVILDDENNIVKQTVIDDEDIQEDNLVDLNEARKPTRIKLTADETAIIYTVAKVSYGSVPGYRLTDLTYAGDLISNVGETLTSMLDKIVSMLGDFEYFYNLDGKFVFQKKTKYASIPWNNTENGDKLPVEDNQPMWSFLNSQLISAFQNTPNLSNVKNDFAVWGKRKTTAGSELDIHMRYAIDTKPEQYTTLRDRITYIASEERGQKDTIIYCDWREIIYQMALDYRRFYHDDDFLFKLAAANPHYPTGRTGYEQYYTDMEGFWRDIYNSEPEPNYIPLQFDKNANDNNICVFQPFRPLREEDLKAMNYSYLYVGVDGKLVPFLGGYCQLEEGTIYGYLTDSATLNETKNKDILLQNNFNNIYLTREEFWVKDLTHIPFYAEEEQYIVSLYSHNADKNFANYKLLADRVYEETIKKWRNKEIILYVQEQSEEPYLSYNEILQDELLKSIYLTEENEYVQEFSIPHYNLYGELIDEDQEIKTIQHFQKVYDYDTTTYWHNDISNNPERLVFWFDFLDAAGSEIDNYSVRTIGTRAKALNDNDVKAIYYKEVPKVIFQTGNEIYEHQTGYTYVQLQNTMENLFTISSRAKSAKERIEELLYQHACLTNNISLTTLPIYHLEPNSRIIVQNEKSQINGEYLVNKITIPLTYNGTMTITANKVIEELI